MTRIALNVSCFNGGRVIGTGTLLDSSRLRQSLSETLGVSPRSIEAFVLGEHGDSAVAAFSTVRVGGMTLDGFLAGQPLDRGGLARQVNAAGYEIIKGKGYTSFGVATAIVRICEAIVRDERSVLPVSTRLEGEFGLEEVCLSLPCVLGAGGVVKNLEPEPRRRRANRAGGVRLGAGRRLRSADERERPVAHLTDPACVRSGFLTRGGCPRQVRRSISGER